MLHEGHSVHRNVHRKVARGQWLFGVTCYGGMLSEGPGSQEPFLLGWRKVCARWTGTCPDEGTSRLRAEQGLLRGRQRRVPTGPSTPSMPSVDPASACKVLWPPRLQDRPPSPPVPSGIELSEWPVGGGVRVTWKDLVPSHEVT